MNEQAIRDAYDLAVRDGYTDTIDDFKTLISSNPEALNDAYNLVAKDGYTDTIDDFKTLMGLVSVVEPTLKKKEDTQSLASDQATVAVPPPMDQEQTPPQQEQIQNLPITGVAEPGIAKSDTTVLPSAPSLSALPSVPVAEKVEPVVAEQTKEETKGYLENLLTSLGAGAGDVNQMIASLPESAYNLLAIPHNAIAWATGMFQPTDANKFGEYFGIENPVLKYFKTETDKLNEENAKFSKANYKNSSIYENIKDGNYGDAFALLGDGIVRNAPVSLAMMAGGATTTLPKLVAASTVGFYQQKKEEVDASNPDLPQIQKDLMALGLSGAESVFSSIGEGTIGSVYKDILKKEGSEAAPKILKDGLVSAYKDALEKYGAATALVGEGVEEGVTQIVQNVIMNKPAFEGVTDAFILGSGSGAVFGAPINAINAIDKVKTIADKNKSKEEITQIAKDGGYEDIDIFNIPKDDKVNLTQIQIANTKHSRDILEKSLRGKVNDGSITLDDAKQSMYVFDKLQQVSNSVKDLNVSDTDKVEIVNLLKERDDLNTKIQNKDNALIVREKKRIDDINYEIGNILFAAEEKAPAYTIDNKPTTKEELIKKIDTLTADNIGKFNISVKNDPELETLLKEKTDAIQKPSTDESLLGSKQPTVELQEMGEGNAQPQGPATGTQETITIEKPKEVRTPEQTVKALEELPTEDKKGITFTDSKGTEVSLEGNEKTLADLYNEVKDIPETDRTDAQESVIDAHDVALADIGMTAPTEVQVEVAPTETQVEVVPLEKPQKVRAPEEPKVLLSGLRDGFYPVDYESVDIRMNGDTKNSEVEDKLNQEESFAGRLTKNGKKYITVGLRLKENLGNNNVRGRDNYSIATVEDNGNLPTNIEEILTKAAVKNISNIYKNIKDPTIDLFKPVESSLGIIAPTEVQAEVAPIEVQAETTQDLLTLDTKDKTNLKRVYDHLDALDKKLDQFGKETLGMNIPVVLAKAVVKSLKAFVNAGMTLEAAIRKAAQTHKIKEDDVLTALDTVSKINENKLEGVSEFELPGYNRMIKEVTETIIPKNQKRGVPYAKGINNVIEYVMTSKAYENATDVQREQIIRDVRKMYDLKEKTAPSAKKILGAEKPKMVTANEKTALTDQIKLEVKAARDAKTDLNTKRRMLNRAIKDMVNIGKITVRQAKTLINKVSTVNLDNDAAVNQIVEYADKVFNKAENKSKVEDGIKLRKQISKLSRNKEKNVDLTNLGKAFAKIDPSMVDDIDAYNEMASQIHESIKGSTIRGTNVNSVEMVNISEAYDYTNKAIEAQNEKIKEKLAADLQEVMGMDAGDLTIDQMIDLLKSDKPIPADNEKKIRAKISKLFDVYSSIIESSIETGIDPITGEDISYTKPQQRVIKDFMSMDVNNFTDPKNALAAVDALKNFLENKSTAKMDDVFSRYTGEQNVKELAEQGIHSEDLKLYGSESIGRLFAEQFTALPLVFERMFKGFEKGGMIEDAIGMTKLKNSKAKSEHEFRTVVNDYMDKFYNEKIKANEEAFNTLYNNVERGIAAFVFRSKMGTEAEMQQEFEYRKKLVQESIDVLSKGTDQEKIKAEQYQKAYDKILKDSNTREEVKDKTDKTNLEAIDYWTNVWAERYDQIADVSLNTYNTILEKDFNYNPDKYIETKGKVPDVQLTSDKSAFLTNSGLYKKKSSGLMETQELTGDLPKGLALDFSFDKNNSNSLYDVLVDINTAPAIRQIEAAIKSEAFEKVVERTEDRKLLIGRINLYVDNIRRKRIVDADELNAAVTKLNYLARIGAGMALADPLQAVKQFVPVMFNTLTNAGTFDIAAFTDLNKMKFIDESGYAIANRGVESQAQIESINKLIEKATDSNDPKKALEYIRQASDMWLKIFLVKPDVAIARASWLAYYEKSLREQDIDPSTIDYSNHELNEKAANYAQRSIDRQQNISDIDLQGKIFSSTDPVKKSVISSLMPFASFRMNQTMRMMSDVINLTSKSKIVSKEDKAIAAKSLAGFGVEMAAFKAIAGVSSFFLGSIAIAIRGEKEDEEKRKKRWANTWKGQLTGTVSDVLSPLPLLDNLVTYGVGTAQDLLNVDEDSSFRIYKDSLPKTIAKSLGMYGIALDKVGQVAELISIAESGKYKDEFGRDKYITREDQKNLKALIIPSILISSGITPIGPSGSSIIRNSVKFAKKDSSTLTPDAREEKDRTTKKNKEKQLDKVKDEVNVLDKLITREPNYKIREAMVEKKNDLEMTDEERKDQKEEIKKEREDKRQKMEELLGGYDNQGDMKKYKPALWLKKFGPNSPYGKEHKYEIKANEKFRKKLTELKDRAYRYTKKTRSSRETR